MVDLNEDPEEIKMRTKMKIYQERKKKKGIKIAKKAAPIVVPNNVEFMSPEGKADADYLKHPEDQSSGNVEENQTQAKGKKGESMNIGVFLQNKQMTFGEDSLVPQEGGKPSLIDYNAFKRGANFMIDEEEELRKREQEEQEK